MKIFKFVFVLSSLLGACNAKKQKPAHELITSRPPNVIIILADDLGYEDTGFNGGQEIPTPNIDRIAANGVKFTNGYVSYAACGPSRAGLITGRYQDRFGFCRNPLFAPNDSLMGLPLSEETLADVLKKADYSTMAIGKWHLGAHEQLRPMQRGFDGFFGFLAGGHRYFPDDWTFKDVSEVKRQWDSYRTRLLRNNTRIDVEGDYLTDILSDEAVSFVTANAKDPFFLYLAYNAPHTPLQATEKYLSRFSHIRNEKRKTYAAMVSAMDDGIGKVLDQLEALDITENTMIFFLSDNGGPEDVNASDNGPLREGKGSMYEGGIRVPFAMQWPAEVPAGTVYENPVIALDIFATVVAHAKVHPKNPLDGVDLTPYLNRSDPGAPHKHLFWRKFDKSGFAVRAGDMKLVNADGLGQELFNLLLDTGESKPLIDIQPGDSLFSNYKHWESAMIPPAFLGLWQRDAYNKLHPHRFSMEPNRELNPK